MIQALARIVTSFCRENSGNIAVSFGLAVLPITMSVGAAVDYSLANRTKTILNEYADAAALSAVSKSAMSLTADAAKTNAANFFKAQAATLKRGSVGNVSAAVTDSATVRTAVVSYTARVPTAFMGLASINNIAVSGSTAASATPAYIDFYLLLDNTPSMGVGATPADVTKMVNNTSDQCAFACHQLDISPNDYYGLAKKAWGNNAHRCGAKRDATAYGHGDRDSDGTEPISHGDLHVWFVRKKRRLDENL